MRAGSKEHKGTVQRMVQPGGLGHASTSDTIKSKSKRPCLIIRPAVNPIHTCSKHPSDALRRTQMLLHVPPGMLR